MQTGINQPSQRPADQFTQPTAHQTTLQQSTGGGARKQKNARRSKVLVCASVLVVLVALGLFWSWWLFGRNTSFNENTTINKNEFQAIFLTNGQVYFGKLADLNNKYVTIKDVYYLQVQSN